MGADQLKLHLVPARQCSSLGTFCSHPWDPRGWLSARHTLPCPCHMLLMVSHTSPSPMTPGATSYPPQASLLTCPTRTWARITLETGLVSSSMLLPAGFCGELGPCGSRVPAGEGTSFPSRGFKAPAPIT